MSLLDAINERISQLQAATDANYKAAGYAVPTSAQRKVAELTGQNPYEYATQLKQAEDAQKEAEKAAKAMQKQAERAARQSSSKGSSGSGKRKSSSKSSSQVATSAPSGNGNAMSSLFGSESETIPSIKDSEKTKEEKAKAFVDSRKKVSASTLAEASKAALQGVKPGVKKGTKSEEAAKKAVEQNEKEEKQRRLSASESTGLSRMQNYSNHPGIGKEPEEKEEKTNVIQGMPQPAFDHGSMESELFTYRNADAAVRKAQEDAKKNPQTNLIGSVTDDNLAPNGPLPGLTGWSYTSNDHALTLDNQTAPILDPLNNALTRDPRTQEYEAPVVIDKSNYTDYLGADRVLTTSEEKAANTFIDSYKQKNEKYENVAKALKDLDKKVARPDTRNFTDVSEEQRKIVEENGITWGELQEYKQIYSLENKLSNMAALGAGLSRIDDNLWALTYGVSDDLSQHIDSMLPDWIMSEEEKAERSHNRFERQLNDARRRGMAQATAAQNPVAYGAGSFGYQAALTALSGGLLSGSGAVEYIGNMMGGSALAKALAETGLETLLVDIPTDTIPEAIENYNNGMPLDQIIVNAGWNVLGNVGLNTVMDMGLPYLRGDFAKAASDQADTLVRSADDVIPGMNNADNILRTNTDDIDSLIKNAQNQFDTASNNLDDLSRQLQNSLDDQIDEPIRSVTDIPSAEPISVRQDIEGLQNQWDDYLKGVSNETPGSLEVTAPKLDDLLQRTYASYMDELAKASSTDDIVEIMQRATHDLRIGSLNEEQFESLVKIATGDTADVAADTAASNVMRTGLDTIHPEYNMPIGDMVTEVTDDMKTAVDDFGVKYADLLGKNETIRAKYENLSKAVDDFNYAAFHTNENLDDYYRRIDATRKNLQRNLKKVDEGASKDILFSNSKNGVIKRADQARFYINSNIDIPDPNEAMDWLPGFEGMTRSEMEDSAKNLFAEEGAKAVPNQNTSSATPQASGGSNVPGANRLQFFGDGKADSKDWRTRGFRTNTAESMGWGDALPEEDYAYKVLHTDTQHKIAEERYKGSESVMNDLLNKNYDSFDAPDIKAGMTEIQSLMDGGDNVSANRLAKRVAYEGTNAGQVAQAFKEYNKNTSSGALTEAYMTQNERVVKPWKSRNKKAVEGNSRLASALAKMGDDTKTVTDGTVQLTHDQVKKGVIAELEKEYGSIENTFSNADIEFLTEMAEDKSIPVWQITSEIEHKFNTGDWYTLDESIELPKPQNQKLQTALNDLVNKEVRKEAPPKTLNQIKAEVQNTLDSNSSSFSGNFTDSDVDYLANLINQGASKQELEDALNTKLATGTFGISEETQQAVNDLFKQASMYDENSKQFVELQMEAYRLLANEIAPNATAWEKFDSWRYLAMLGNPKTMLRNTVGNITFNLVTSFSNSVAALGEAGVDKIVRGLGGDGIQRTKALLGTGDTDLIKSSWLDANNSRFRQLTGAKYEKFNDNSILGARSTFNSKPMQAYEKFVDWGINDYPAARTKYSTSLAGYLKANGYDNSIFDAEVKLDRLKNLSEQRLLTDAEQASVEQLTKDVNALEKARDYAVKQAEYATFHEDNKIANVLSEWSRASKERGTGIGSKVIEGTVPFKRTPANILRSALEYSPLGAIDSIRKTGKLIYENTGKRAGNLAETYLNKKGKEVTKTLAADVIDSWSKTLTGVGLVGLGVYLYDKGILNVSDKDLKYQDQLEGKQNYSITINGHTYTIDWAAPSAIPLFLGAELAKIWPATGNDTEYLYDNLDGYLAAFTRMMDPIVETSMLSGVRDTLTNAATAVQNNDNMDMITSILAGSLTGYATQAIPTFSGQLARTIDNTRRSSYTDKEGAAGAIDRQLKKTMNKIPGLSFLNEPYVDTYGRQQQNSPFGNPIANFAYQALSPGYLANVNTTAADTLSRNMYNIDQDTKMLPAFKSSVKVDGERVSPEDYTRYAKTYGQANYEIRTALANDEWFNGLTPTEQKTIVEGINNVANKVGMAEIDPNFESDDGAYTAYKEFGMEGLLDYYKETTEKNHIKSVATAAGADKFTVTDTVLKAYEEGITVNGKTLKGDDAVTMYTQAAMYLKENGMDNNEKNRQMYYDNQLTELQKKKTVTDAANKYDMEYSAQNAEVLDTYGEEGLEAKQSLLAAGYSFGDPEKKLYAEGGLPAIQGYIDDLNALGTAGLKTTYTTYSGYQDANNTIPGGITPAQYANAVKAMDTNNNSTVNQSEFLDYVNSNNFSEEEVKLLWNAFGEWKTEPYIKADGTWGAHRVK